MLLFCYNGRLFQKEHTMLRGTFFYDPGFPVRPWGLMLVVGFLVAIWVASRLFKQRGMSSEHAINITFWVFIASVIGARLFFLIPRVGDPAYNLAGPAQWIAVWDGGMVFYGGLLGGILATLIYAKVQRLQVRDVLDIAAVGLVIGYAFGRIGCFLNGCCYGTPTDLPWGVVYPPTAPIWTEQNYHMGTPVHPTQLYDSLLHFIFFFVLLWTYRRFSKGVTMLTYIAIYIVSRFSLEFIRADNPIVFWFMDRIQVVTVALFLAFILQVIAVMVGKSRKVNPDQVYFWGVLLTPLAGLGYALFAPEMKVEPVAPPAPTPTKTKTKKK
jgi:phosphatidylglycerol:prolipoprotein diacylglycerol transferase